MSQTMRRKDATSYKLTKQGVLPRQEVVKLEVIGTKKGLLTLRDLSGKNKKITPGLIKEIHMVCFSDVLLKHAGASKSR